MFSSLNRVSRNALTMIVILLLVISALGALKSSTSSKYTPLPPKLPMMVPSSISQSNSSVPLVLVRKVALTPRV